MATREKKTRALCVVMTRRRLFSFIFPVHKVEAKQIGHKIEFFFRNPDKLIRETSLAFITRKFSLD